MERKVGSEGLSVFNVQELQWELVRKEIKQAAPQLFEVIESLDPDDTLTLIKARYPYGATIYD